MRKSFLLVVLAMLGVLGEAVSANLVRAERVAPQGASAKPASVSVVRDLLRQPEETIDLAKAKLTIDRMFDHSGTARPEQTLRLIEEWADKVRARVPPGASGQRTMDALVSTLYESGAWNDFRPFSYDYDTPPAVRICRCPRTSPRARASASPCRRSWSSSARNSTCRSR